MGTVAAITLVIIFLANVEARVGLANSIRGAQLETIASSKQVNFKSIECQRATSAVSWQRRIFVTSSVELQTALDDARAGDVIELASGSYNPISSLNGNRLTIQNKNGNARFPIIICGPRTAIIDDAAPIDPELLPSPPPVEPPPPPSPPSPPLDDYSFDPFFPGNGRKLHQQDGFEDSGIDETMLPSLFNVDYCSFVHLVGIRMLGANTAGVGVVINNSKSCQVRRVGVTRVERTGIYCMKSSEILISDADISYVWRGVALSYSKNSTLKNLKVSFTANCGIKLRRNSTNNEISGCHITDTGLINAGYGEGIYIGSSTTNSYYLLKKKKSGKTGLVVFKPDRSNNNKITKNILGPRVTAEMIDAKPLTSGGTISFNQFDGTNIALGEVGADSWCALNGDNYKILSNKGKNTPLDGFATRVVATDPGSATPTGLNNLYRGNTCDMTGALGGGFCIHIRNSQAVSKQNNVVQCDNRKDIGTPQVKLTNVKCSAASRSKSPGRGSARDGGAVVDQESGVDDTMLEPSVYEDDANHDDPPPKGWLNEFFPV